MEALEPARSIIQRLGGKAKVADITGAAPSAPYRWEAPRERGGTGGLIPQRYHLDLLDYARKHGIELTAEDFLPVAPRSRKRSARSQLEACGG